MRYVAIRSEGGLIPYDLLDKIATDDAAGQKPADFGLPKGRRLTDEISRVWADAQSFWSNFKRRRESLGDRDPYGTSITRSWIGSLLGDVDMLGFDLKLQASAVVVNNSTYAISHRSGEGEDAIPVHVEGLKIDLDRRLHTKLRTSPQAMVQDFVNNNELTVWGIVTNGTSLRILRNSSRTSRPTYLEFDLESILEGNRFNEFALLYRVCHRSRFPGPGQEPSDCLLERYYQDSLEQGLRVRDKLREGVEETLKILGTGFLQHPANESLRERMSSGQLTAVQFHRQLLLLVYRLLFLMVAEERGLIVSIGENADGNQRIYDEWYSITRLRDRAAQIIDASPFGDVWQGLQQTFSLFEYGLDTNPLNIPPLNGDLFHQEHAIPDLKGTELYNHELLRAIRHLSLFKDANVQQRVNYSALDVEELGSVYESLLDYQPVLLQSDRGLVFELRTGMERKSSGSYYTRPELVHELVESALVPVMEERIAEAEKASEGKNLVEEQKAKIGAILNMTVCDPACGSGHFLLAAARRLGKELARIKTGEDEPKPEDFHLAVREVIAHCVYGVDLNPLAVDLCKLALWLEGHWASKPLSFLDHRIRCGNSLIGLLDPKVLEEGIPDDAFTGVTGDDKNVAAFLKKRNKKERTSRQRGFTFEADDHTGEYAASNRELRVLAENTAADVRKKAQMYSSWRAGMQHSHDEAVADLWTAQFFLPLTSTTDGAICTTKDFLEFAVDKQKKPQQVAAAQEIAQQMRFFHWHLEFPEVFQNEGFDVVLGNPPWEKVKLQEEEHWIDEEYISLAPNKAVRQARIQEYRDSGIPNKIARVARFETAKHAIECQSKCIRNSARFELSAVGDVNTYALFSELAFTLISAVGRFGIIVPTGIATDDGCKRLFGLFTGKAHLASLFDFENRNRYFPEVDSRMKFSLLTVGRSKIPKPRFAFYCADVLELGDSRKIFDLTPADLTLMNPNTGTCPVFRTRMDADLTTKFYRLCPVLVNEALEQESWSLRLLTMFHMANDSGLFRTGPQLEQQGFHLEGRAYKEGANIFLPLFEGKMFQQYDHRSAAVVLHSHNVDRQGQPVATTLRDHENPDFLPLPAYWVERKNVVDYYVDDENMSYYIAFKAVTSPTNERTAITTFIPFAAIHDNAPIVVLKGQSVAKKCLFVANFNSIPFDYVVRQKTGNVKLMNYVFKQLPVLPPASYTEADEEFIAGRVLKLVYTANDLKNLARDLGYEGSPFAWSEPERADVRAELDAYFAHLYQLTRDELRYILDPKDVFGEDFPSETFRVLREREIKDYGEYRTRRLVLEAYDEFGKSDRFRNELAKRVSSLGLPNKQTSVTGKN